MSTTFARREFVGRLAADRATMILDAECRVARDPNREERLLWEEP